MGWLFAQLWMWLLLSFLLGSAVTALVLRLTTPSWERAVAQTRQGAREPHEAVR